MQQSNLDFFSFGRQREVKGFLRIETLPPIITQIQVFPVAKIEPSLHNSSIKFTMMNIIEHSLLGLKTSEATA